MQAEVENEIFNKNKKRVTSSQCSFCSPLHGRALVDSCKFSEDTLVGLREKEKIIICLFIQASVRNVSLVEPAGKSE